jgi:hypothetical protein
MSFKNTLFCIFSCKNILILYAITKHWFFNHFSPNGPFTQFPTWLYDTSFSPFHRSYFPWIRTNVSPLIQRPINITHIFPYSVQNINVATTFFIWYKIILCYFTVFKYPLTFWQLWYFWCPVRCSCVTRVLFLLSFPLLLHAMGTIFVVLSVALAWHKYYFCCPFCCSFMTRVLFLLSCPLLLCDTDTIFVVLSVALAWHGYYVAPHKGNNSYTKPHETYDLNIFFRTWTIKIQTETTIHTVGKKKGLLRMQILSNIMWKGPQKLCYRPIIKLPQTRNQNTQESLQGYTFK